MFQKHCDYCGQEFSARRSIDIYCSDECRKAGTAEKARQRDALWRINNPERARETDKNWRLAHPDEARQGVTEWHKANPEKRREHRAKYRETHVEEIKQSKAEWVKNNLQKAVLYHQRRRALLAGNGGSYTEEEWEDLKASYNYRCLSCGRVEPEIKLTIDHVIPITLGGSNDITNIQPLCGSCNKRKGTQLIDYRP